MREYVFSVNIAPDDKEFLRVAQIRVKAESWHDRARSYRFAGGLDALFLEKFLTWEAYRMYGHTFSLDSFSPSELYEALYCNREYKFTVEGDDVPDDPIADAYSEPLPEGAIY